MFIPTSNYYRIFIIWYYFNSFIRGLFSFSYSFFQTYNGIKHFIFQFCFLITICVHLVRTTYRFCFWMYILLFFLNVLIEMKKHSINLMGIFGFMHFWIFAFLEKPINNELHSMHLHFIFSQYPSWGLDINEIWIC
jgi:hypothetical protein